MTQKEIYSSNQTEDYHQLLVDLILINLLRTLKLVKSSHFDDL